MRLKFFQWRLDVAVFLSAFARVHFSRIGCECSPKFVTLEVLTA